MRLLTLTVFGTFLVLQVTSLSPNVIQLIKNVAGVDVTNLSGNGNGNGNGNSGGNNGNNNGSGNTGTGNGNFNGNNNNGGSNGNGNGNNNSDGGSHGNNLGNDNKSGGQSGNNIGNGNRPAVLPQVTVKAQPSEPVTPPPQVRTPAARPVQPLGTDITGDQPRDFLPNAQVQGNTGTGCVNGRNNGQNNVGNGINGVGNGQNNNCNPATTPRPSATQALFLPTRPATLAPPTPTSPRTTPSTTTTTTTTPASPQRRESSVPESQLGSVTSWSLWSRCSARFCGGLEGTQTRRRACFTHDKTITEPECVEHLFEEQRCVTPLCDSQR